MKKYIYLIFLLCFLSACKPHESTISTLAEQEITTQNKDDNNALIQAFQDKKSNIFVEGAGIVKKLLPDDNKGSRHQKFLLSISTVQTLLFAHNIDLTDPVPLAVGDTIQFRGEYVYNPKGGVVHWTHHDPQGKIEGGWIKYKGKTYQ
ncbi:MAG: DUF3465 domain-containing protein [Methylotenera sp.]|nr:DUF3465 domain-containing protein [Methylotenera sp.]